ncbi:MAG: lysophospholipid acyltransferase family protein [Myxococcaceae bacterium]|nr:lysophospholipid acyltransferase family protein [Myxococcaceae bacterium]MCI0672938.1 lysophospholipid acyltransferase family protein [Myxococcaceae bacterium]
MSDLAPLSAPTPQSLSTRAGPVAARGVDVVVRVLSALSPRTRRRISELVGGLAFGLGIRRRVTLDNLRQALPGLPEAERRRIARGAYVNMAHTVLDALTSSAVDPAQAGELLVDGAGAGAFHTAVAQGKGVLLATGHLGSWELFGALLQKRGIPMSGVVRPLKGAFNARIVENRVRAGSELIAPRGALAGTLRALRRGRVVFMVIDQSISAEHGVFVPFFGRPASTAPAVSLAAVRSGAPVFFGYGRRVDGRFVFEVEGPLTVSRTADLRADLTAHTALLTERLERAIRTEPSQWLWLHRRWKVKPP